MHDLISISVGVHPLRCCSVTRPFAAEGNGVNVLMTIRALMALPRCEPYEGIMVLRIGSCDRRVPSVEAMSWEYRTDRIDHDGPELLWQQVSTDLRSEIESGALPAGLKFPGSTSLPMCTGVRE
jgi:hypothetical protein